MPLHRRIWILAAIAILSANADAAPACLDLFHGSRPVQEKFLANVSQIMASFPEFDTWKAEDAPRGEKFQRGLLKSFATMSLQEDSPSVTFRSTLPEPDLTRAPKTSDGTMAARATELSNRLKLYGRVLGTRDGALVVVAPETYLNASTPAQVTLRMYVVRRFTYSASDPATAVMEVGPKSREAESLADGVLRKLFSAATGFDSYARQSYSGGDLIPTVDQAGGYYVEASVSFTRETLHPENERMKRVLEILD